MPNLVDLLSQGPIVLRDQTNNINSIPSTLLDANGQPIGVVPLLVCAVLGGTCSVIDAASSAIVDVGESVNTIWTYTVKGVNSDIDYLLTVPKDPLSYEFEEDAGSPDLASLTLPFLPGIASYEISTETGLMWSPLEILNPATTLSFELGVDGFILSALDELGQMVPIDDPLILDVTFASDGNFNGTVTTTSGSVPEPSSLAILAVSFAMILLTILRQRQAARARNDASAPRRWVLELPFGRRPFVR